MADDELARLLAETEREVNRMEYPHIIRTPETCGGLPRIEGTRITVNLIVREVVRLRQTPEEVLIAHPHLTLAQIHAALAYYFDHREQIDVSLREADDLEADLRTQFPSRLRRVPSS
jgi:uncharacterized protein (DUF433 family)